MSDDIVFDCKHHGPFNPRREVACPHCMVEVRSRLAEREAEIATNGRHAMRVTIAQLEARLAEAEALLREALPAVQSYARKHGRAVIAAARRNDADHAAKHADIEISAWSLADRIRAALGTPADQPTVRAE